MTLGPTLRTGVLCGLGVFATLPFASGLVAQSEHGGGRIEGRALTRDGADLTSIPEVVIRLMTPMGRQVTTTDATGAFRFDGLVDGDYRVRAERLGYAASEIEVVLRGERSVSIDLLMDVVPVHMGGVRVRGRARAGAEPESGDPTSQTDGADPSRELVGRQALEGGSGMGASGMGGLLESLPGNEPSEPGDVLFMRGSSLDLKLVVLDGAPLYTPFHVSGLLAPFDPHVLASARVHNGAAPAEFDGGLAQTMDLQIRDPSKGDASASGALDLMSARAAAWTSLGEHSGVLVGGRGLHGAAERLFGEGFPYGYRDGVARLQLGLNEAHRMTATGFANRESVSLDFATAAGPGGERVAANEDPADASWGNSAVTVGYEGEGERTAVRARAAWSQYEASLPVRSRLPLVANGATTRLRAVLQVERFSPRGGVRLGASMDALELDYQAQRLSSDSTDTPITSRTRSRGSVPALFADARVQLGEGVSLRAALRAARYESVGLRLAPRASLTWLFDEGAALTLRAGRADQLTTSSRTGVESALSVQRLDDPQVLEVPFQTDAGLLSVASASEVVVSLDQVVSPRTRVGLDGWLRRYDGDRGLSGLSGSGVDLRIARVGESVSGWVGYSLNWFWSDDPDLGSPFDGRQLLSAGLSGALGSSTNLDIQLALGNGLPFTAVPVGDPAAAPGLDVGTPTVEVARRELDSATDASKGAPPLSVGPSGDFLRVDAEISWMLTPAWGGHTMALRPYVRVMNALNRRDALFYYFEAFQDTGARPLAEMSLIPVVGIAWQF